MDEERREARADGARGQARGRVDLPAILYVVGGVPALVLFLVLLFWGARACDLPA